MKQDMDEDCITCREEGDALLIARGKPPEKEVDLNRARATYSPDYSLNGAFPI